MVKRHMLTHSSPSFFCPSCNKPFKRKDTLRLHIIKSHPDSPETLACSSTGSPISGSKNRSSNSSKLSTSRRLQDFNDEAGDGVPVLARLQKVKQIAFKTEANGPSVVSPYDSESNLDMLNFQEDFLPLGLENNECTLNQQQQHCDSNDSQFNIGEITDACHLSESEFNKRDNNSEEDESDVFTLPNFDDSSDDLEDNNAIS